jgi:hypothetical protein
MSYARPINIALILILLIVIYYIGKKNKLWGKAELGADKVKLDPESKPVKPGFSAENKAVELAELLSYTDFNDLGAEKDRKDYRAFQKILELNYNELRSTHNAWTEKFRGGKFWSGIKDTLRKQIEAEFIPFWRSEATGLKKRVLQRLDYLNL